MMADALPQAQAYLDREWAAQIALARERLGQRESEVLPALARAMLPVRHVLARQTVQMNCHASSRHGVGIGVGASVRFTPVSVDIYLRHERILDRAWRIEATVEQIALHDQDVQQPATK